MNLRGIIIICGIIVIIAMVGLLALNQNNVLHTTSPTPIADTVTISDKSKITVGSDISDSSSSERIEQENVVNQHNDAKYWIDENGVKHYIVEVEDSPSLGK